MPTLVIRMENPEDPFSRYVGVGLNKPLVGQWWQDDQVYKALGGHNKVVNIDVPYKAGDTLYFAVSNPPGEYGTYTLTIKDDTNAWTERGLTRENTATEVVRMAPVATPAKPTGIIGEITTMGIESVKERIFGKPKNVVLAGGILLAAVAIVYWLRKRNGRRRF